MPAAESPAAPDPSATQTSPAEPSGADSRPWLEWAVVAMCSLTVLAGLAPEDVLTDVLPWRTDLTGHVIVPWLDAQNIVNALPGAWSDAMFGGFPLNQLYPVLPSLMAGMLSWVLPLAIAFKIVVVAPLVLLPWGAWRAATWAALPQPLPAMLAVATLPFVYDTSCVSCGGNIASTINGEYAFAWAMLFAVLALGAVDRLAARGGGPVTAAALVAATALSHPLPTLWLIIGIFVIAVGREVWTDPQVRRPFALAALGAALVAAMWWLPFVLRRDWMPLVGFPRRDDLVFWLLPASPVWEAAILLLALAGAVWGVRTRAWLLNAVTVQTAVAGVAIAAIGEGGQIYNLRALPFWYYGRWALAAVGFAWAVSVVARRVRSDRTAPDDPRVAPVTAVLLAISVIGSTWGWWGVTTPATAAADGEARVLGQTLTVTKQSIGPAFVLGGPRTEVQLAAFEALEGLVKDVAEVKGCGRLAWDETITGDAGTPGTFEVAQAPWQSPIWTDGCITPLTGILNDSSATAPAAQLTQDLVSTAGLRVLPSLDDVDYNLTAGVNRMRTMGVRYYLTQGGQPAADAAANPGLVQVASAGPWTIWELPDAALVAAMTNQPAVVDPPLGDAEWIPVSTAYFLGLSFDTTPLAQSGPESWERVAVGVYPKDVANPAVAVSNVRATADSVTFDVDRVGVPIVVRMSYYPGWSAVGADGPYRATPNFMVVVPTSTTVTLTKGRTWVDWIAIALGAAGIVVLGSIVVGRRRGASPVGAVGTASEGDGPTDDLEAPREPDAAADDDVQSEDEAPSPT